MSEWEPGDEFFQRFVDEEELVRERYNTLVENYDVPVKNAVQSIEQRYQSKPEGFDNIPNSPYKVDPGNIREVERTVRGHEAKEIGDDLQNGANYVVYFTECELHGDGRLKDAKNEAVRFLPSVSRAPDWVYYAWKADSVYYIGQTADFGQRLKAHCCHLRQEDRSPDNPSMLTGISIVTRAGIIHRCDSRTRAEEVEEAVAKRWSTSDERRFVYFA